MPPKKHETEEEFEIAIKLVDESTREGPKLLDIRRSSQDRNALIIRELDKLIEYTERQIQSDPANKKSNGFRLRQFKNARNIISSLDQEITSKSMARAIKGIGAGIADRIDEILKTGRLSEIDEPIQTDAKTVAITELMTVTGIGDKMAEKLYQSGYSSVAKLRTAHQMGEITLTHHAEVGLKYHDDLQQRIPRQEIDLIASKLRQLLLTHVEPELIISICGSYRRGFPTSGDIDVLISHREIQNSDDLYRLSYLKKIVAVLTKAGLLIENLTVGGESKYMGICRSEDSDLANARRIDIRVIPYPSYYYALLYFTGSKNLNIIMRRTALELGYNLSEFGLTDKKGQNVLDKVESEESIFSALGLRYLKPEDREIN